MEKQNLNKVFTYVVSLFLLASLSFWSSVVKADETNFDLTHARTSLHYFEQPNLSNISHVAFTEPAAVLAQFYNVNKSSNNKTTFQATKELLTTTPNAITLNHVRALLTHISDQKNSQTQCYKTALKHLPENFKFDNPLYIVWAGGDLANEDGIINLATTSMLDITNPIFAENQAEIWQKCIHALHHAGMNKLNPTPFHLSEITQSHQLLAYIEHITLFEGSAYYASNKKAVNLIDAKNTLAKFEQIKNIFNKNNEELNIDKWTLFDDHFVKNKLARDMGALMAASIDQNHGREALLQSYKGGAASFFKLFTIN